MLEKRAKLKVVKPKAFRCLLHNLGLIQDLLRIHIIPYKKAIAMAFDKIEQNEVVSSWKDALTK